MPMTRRSILIILLTSVLVFTFSRSATAANPYLPITDTYTDSSNPGVNHGSETLLLLSASNVAGCVPVTYLWYKFSIPATTQTIGTANLYLAFEDIGGSNTLDVELLSSSDTSWSEAGLTWGNQPALDSTVLATALSVPRGSTATFSSVALSSYLDAHQGQPVTLVVRANCSGTVAASANRGTRTQEHASGSGIYLDLFTPTSVTLGNLNASAVPNSGAPLLIIGLLVLSSTVLVVRRRR